MFRRLVIEDLRCVAHTDLLLGGGTNVLVGPNGAGKTTILESVHLLALGRSFRHRETAPLLREGGDRVRLFCGFDSEGVDHRLGMEQQDQGWRVRLDGVNARRRSSVLSLLPIQWLGADPQSLLTGVPELRRGFVDAGMFHVEHTYLGHVQAYQRALDQRNAALRLGDREYSMWDTLLEREAAWLDESRSAYIAALMPRVLTILNEWAIQIDFQYSYLRGWDSGRTLLEALEANRKMDERRRFTGVGCHRADLVIKAGSLRSGKRLSRGQLKMLVSALFLAQAELLTEKTGKRYVLLYDDLAAELDEGNRAWLLQMVSRTYRQAIVTSLASGDLPNSVPFGPLFHVEHGAVIPVP